MCRFLDGFEKRAASLGTRRVDRILRSLTKKGDNAKESLIEAAGNLYDKWSAKKLHKRKVRNGKQTNRQVLLAERIAKRLRA